MNPRIDTSAERMAVCLRPTEIMREAARIVASLRTQAHNPVRRPSEDMGIARNQDTDFRGLLGEMALLDELQRAGYAPAGYTLYANHVPVGPDFRLKSVCFEIKVCPPGQRYWSVNEEQRINPVKRADRYIPLVFVDDHTISVRQPVTPDVIGSWPIRSGHSAYRSIDVAYLPPLRNLTDILK